MKNKFFINIFSLVAATFIFASCSDDNTDDGCHGCHLSLAVTDTIFSDAGDVLILPGGEMMWDIKNSSGGDEFCGSELANAEDPSYVHTVTETLYEDATNTPLPPGDYSAANGYEVHCEEHGNHDDHDH